MEILLLANRLVLNMPIHMSASDEGNQLRRLFLRALQIALTSGRIEDEGSQGEPGLDSVVRPAGSQPVVLRKRGPRDFEEIPPSEIFEMVRSIRKMHSETDRESLYRRVLDFYDLKRLTSKVRRSLDKITSDAKFDLSEANGTKKISARVEAGHLIIEFKDGAQDLWELPDRSDEEGVCKVRNAAEEFALTNGASPDQIDVIRKALADAGYQTNK